jgi:hypothetical protein
VQIQVSADYCRRKEIDYSRKKSTGSVRERDLREIEKKALCKKQAEDRKKNNADVDNGSQRTIFNMFDKSMK